MKELSIEEKAKAYDEAIKKVNDYYEGKAKLYSDVDKTLDYLFPELKESEDEKIRKEMLAFFKHFSKNGTWKYIQDVEKWIAWLEKKSQVKYSTISQHEIETFKENNDSLTSEDERIIKTLSNIVKYACDKYGVKYQGKEIGGEKLLSWLEKQGEHANFRSKIQIGDKVTRNDSGVLVNLSQFERVAKETEKQGKQHPKFKVGDAIKKKSTGDIVTISEVDLENREYRLSNTGFIPFKYEHLWELVEQKSVEWGEEDDNMLDNVIALIRDGAHMAYEKEISWLKSLKERVQPKQEWSEEDEYCRHQLIVFCENCMQPDSGAIRCANWLKSLRPQNWTKEDKERYISCLQRLGTGNPEQPETINSKWFKEHVYPQSTWKPSEEMLEALYRVIPNNVMEKSEDEMLLDKLYQGLKYGKVLSEN